MPPTKLELLNFFVQLSFNALMGYYWGIKAVYYLLAATLLSMGLHPMAAHFVAEHNVFAQGYETYSYYGIWLLGILGTT